MVMTPFSVAAYIANARQVRPEEITSFRDLLDPRWRGQILFHDPRIAGNGQATWAFLHQHRDLGPDYLRALVGQNLVILRDDRQELDQLGQGRVSICLGCAEPSAVEMIDKGVPLVVVGPDRMREGGQITSGPGNVALFNRAPHPNAARVYINWLLGKEGQTEYTRATGYPSARLDVTNEGVEPWQFPQPGYWPGYTEEALLEQRPRAIAFARELLGE
jgi:iron(III) transport system substrate-binding protein